MKVDILIRSYYKDFRWLEYCLRSIDKFCRGFNNIVLVVPHSSAERLRWTGMGESLTVYFCEDYEDDYLGQQVTKLTADAYSNADYICHIDSDCVVRRRADPADLFIDGKPAFVITPYRLIPAARGWRRLSERFHQREVEYDFMRRQPLLYPRWLYGALRRFAKDLYGMRLSDYVLSRPPGGFSEFNALGAYAYYHHSDAFTWCERAIPDPDEQFCRWFWSWGGITPNVRKEIESILA